jgi:hypothetical protein
MRPKPGRFCLRQTQDEEFWDVVLPVQTIQADLNEQITALRRLCSFYSFFAFASPHLSATGSGKDLTFALELAKSSLYKPRDFLPVTRIDLHAQGEAGVTANHVQQVEDISQRVRQELGRAANLVRIFLWPTIKERRFLVGHSNVSDLRPHIVWAVAMTHVVRPDSDEPARDRNTFALLDRRETSQLASDFYFHTSLKPYIGSPWMI